MSARGARLAAIPFVVLAFVLRPVQSLWVLPLSWRVEPVGLSVLLATGVLAFGLLLTIGAYLLLVRRARTRPATWRVDPRRRRFVAPAHPVLSGAYAIVASWVLGGGVITERVPGEDRMRLADFGALTTAGACLVVVAIAVTLLVERPRLVLDPDGLALRSVLRRLRIRWDELEPGGPPPPVERGPGALVLYRRPATPVTLATPLVYVDAAFLAHTIRVYAENPDRRAAIGTEAELAELRAVRHHLAIAARRKSSRRSAA